MTDDPSRTHSAPMSVDHPPMSSIPSPPRPSLPPPSPTSSSSENPPSSAATVLRIPRPRVPSPSSDVSSAHPNPSVPSRRLPPSTTSQSAAVIATSDDAAVSKHSCAVLGYYSDPFIHHFIHSPSRRPPLINRGYFTRVAAIHRALLSFLPSPLPSSSPSPSPPTQVISLGAGSDTLYFRLKSTDHFVTRWIDVDFPSPIARKRHLIDRTPALLALAGEGKDVGEGVTRYPDLSLVGGDLRDIPQLEERLLRAGVAWDIPTFVLSECVLVYLPPAEATAVIRWVAERFTGGAVMCAYEQLHPDTAFGRTMLHNLEMRGCPLLSLPSYPTVEAQRERYMGCGYDRYEGWDMLDVHAGYLDQDEVRRAEKIEGLDELEEWNLIQSHYHISMAGKRRSGAQEGGGGEKDERLMRVGLLGAKKPSDRTKGRAIVGEYGRAGPLGLKEVRRTGEGVASGRTRYHPLTVASPALSPSDGSA